MLTGEKLGEAIGLAIEKKGISKKAIAEIFGVKPPSIQDWIKRGTISKDKLFKLIDYFSDVCSNEHWGISDNSVFKVRLENGKQESLIQHHLELTKEEIKLLTEFRKIKTDEGVKDIFKYLKWIIDSQTKSAGSSAADSIQKTQKIKKDY